MNNIGFTGDTLIYVKKNTDNSNPTIINIKELVRHFNEYEVLTVQGNYKKIIGVHTETDNNIIQQNYGLYNIFTIDNETPILKVLGSRVITIHDVREAREKILSVKDIQSEVCNVINRPIITMLDVNGNRIQIKNFGIIPIQSENWEPVYGIEVADDHTYYANSIAVHDYNKYYSQEASTNSKKEPPVFPFGLGEPYPDGIVPLEDLEKLSKFLKECDEYYDLDSGGKENE